MKQAIAILTGGGPAPGMNTVVGSVAKAFLRDGFRVIGLHGGYSALFTETPRTAEIDFIRADEIFNRGGSMLKMSRFKPTDEDFLIGGFAFYKTLFQNVNEHLDALFFRERFASCILGGECDANHVLSVIIEEIKH